MARIIGLSRNLKLPWLNKMTELCLTGLSEQEIKDQLNEYLSYEISSPTNLRKTREILINIWGQKDGRSNHHCENGLRLIGANKDNALPVHWCRMLITYPVFADTVRLIGKMTEFEDLLTASQIKGKLFDEWGERTTLFHSSDKILATLKAMGALESPQKGYYRVKKHKVYDTDVIHYMVYTMMLVEKKGYYSFSDLASSQYLFPFVYTIQKEDILMDSRFTFNTFGGELTIGINQ